MSLGAMKEKKYILQNLELLKKYIPVCLKISIQTLSSVLIQLLITCQNIDV